MICVGKTDVGAKRMNNQDVFRIDVNDRYACAVVCDGMGGANGGSVASRLAADVFARSVHRAMKKLKTAPTSGDLRRMTVNALGEANAEVHGMASAKAELEGMGTTLVSFVKPEQGKTVVVNIGDSRLYSLCGDSLLQVTKDHSFVQFLIDSGTITPDEAKVHPNRNIILRAIGINDDAEGDIFFVDRYDMLMLCTDGLTNAVDDEEIKAVLREDIPLADKCNKLIDLANANEASDNITVVLYG